MSPATVLFMYSVLCLCPIATQFGFSVPIFVEVRNIKLHINPSQWEPCWCLRTDGQTGVTKLTDAFNYSNAPQTVYEGILLVDYVNVTGRGSVDSNIRCIYLFFGYL
jgi:hypothetical protein